MGYEDFVYFILSEEDKTNNISLDYWFKCIDLDCDGALRANEMLVSVSPLRSPPLWRRGLRVILHSTCHACMHVWSLPNEALDLAIAARIVSDMHPCMCHSN